MGKILDLAAKLDPGRLVKQAYNAFVPKMPEITAPPPAPPVLDEQKEKRKKAGRQSTILTDGLLSDITTLKPTLLGQ